MRDEAKVKTTVQVPLSADEVEMLDRFRLAEAATEMSLADLYVLAKRTWMEGRRGVSFSDTSFINTMLAGIAALPDGGEEPT